MENMELELKKLRRSMVITRIFCVIPALLFMVLIAGGVFVWGQVSGIVQEVMPVVEAVSDLDWTELSGTLQEIETAVSEVNWSEVASTVSSLEEAMAEVDWAMVSDKIEQLDVEALNDTLGSIDTEQLNDAVTNLNKAAATLEKITSIFK